MMEINKFYILNIFMIICFIASFANNSFADENISIYQKNAIEYNSNYFHETDGFTIVGNIEINGKKIVLANNIYIWGLARRATWRFLLFFEDGTLLGMYSGIIFNITEIKISDRKIVFPFNAEMGNTIDFSNGIPDRIRIDGEIYTYEEINEIN